MQRIAVPLDPKYFTAFSCYGLLIAVLGTLIVESAKSAWSEPDPMAWLLYLTTGILLVFFVGLITVFDKNLRRLLRTERTKLELLSVLPRKATALIVLVSPGPGASSARWAIEYHKTTLKQLWLLKSTDPESDKQALGLADIARQLVPGLSVHLDVVIPHVHSVDIARSVIRKAIQDARRTVIEPDDIVCDMTGMTKSVSAGMLLAFIDCKVRLTVMEPQSLQADGKPDPKSESIPAEITQSVNFEED